MNNLHFMLQHVIESACDQMTSDYERDVIRGKRSWSGSDLKGTAKKFGGFYKKQRDAARAAVASFGGTVVPIERGRLVTAVIVDDVAYTTEGARMRKGSRWSEPVDDNETSNATGTNDGASAPKQAAGRP